MKKRTLALGVAVCVLTGCWRPGSDENAFQWIGQLPAGSVVHFRDGTGDISVRAGNGPAVQVHAKTHWRHGRHNDIRFVVNHIGSDYYVCAMWRGSGRCAVNGYRGAQFGGILTMFSLFHRTSDAQADFEAQVPSNVIVDASTSNGSVTIDGVTSGVTAHSRNGDVAASNVGGPLNLSTTNGNIRLSADSLAPNDAIHASTTNGIVHAELPANLAASFDLSVVNGSVQSDLPLAAQGRLNRRLEGQIGGSTRVVKLRAVNGSVSLMTRGAAAAH